MQTIALADSWDLSQASKLLDQAVAFEPDYYYYFRNHANYLKPQWNGEEGDAEKFAAQAADRVGGAKGDILYFQIAAEIICHCNAEPNLKLMSWPRIQNGVAELEKQNGVSLTNLNLVAYMAIKQSDSVTASHTFSRIGEGWDKDTWRTRGYFNSSRTWAAQRAAYVEDPATMLIEQAKVKFANVIHDCVIQNPPSPDGGEMTKFFLVLRLQKDGAIDQVGSTP